MFPDQELEQEDFLRVTEYFGEVGQVHRPPKYFPPGFSRILPNILMISNIRENGEPIGVLPDGEMMFHHDMIHAEVPSKATILYSLEIPKTGGDTLFASGYAAYDTLDPKVPGGSVTTTRRIAESGPTVIEISRNPTFLLRGIMAIKVESPSRDALKRSKSLLKSSLPSRNDSGMRRSSVSR